MSMRQLKAHRAYALELLAYAVSELFPGAILLHNHVSDVDFYYDFVLTQPINTDFIPLIEETWRKYLKQKPKLATREMMRENAAEFFQHLKQPFKAEQILAQEDSVVALIQIENFYDLKPFLIEEAHAAPKILAITTLEEDVTRIEATAFPDSQSLKKHLRERALAEKSDHREIGPELDLFRLNESGALFLPRGEILRETLVTWFNHILQQYHLPLIHRSGPIPIQLPNLYRFGAEGVAEWRIDKTEHPDPTHGLFTLSEAQSLWIYPFVSEKTLLQSCISSLQFIEKTIKIFDLNREWVLCSRRSRQISAKEWKSRLHCLEEAAKELKLPFELDEEDHSGSLPRLEMRFSDALGRKWGGPKLQIEGGRPEVSLMGPLEQLIALLVQQERGVLPSWLLPEQVRVLPVTEENNLQGRAIQMACGQEGIRAGIDLGSESLADKVCNAVQKKVPYLLAIGNREVRDGLVAVRRFDEQKTDRMTFEEFVSSTKKEFKTKLES